MTPAVTVLMSAHAGGDYFRQALGSVLAQDFGDFELVLIDDASADDIRGEVERLRDPRVVYRRNEVNLGLTRSLNLGLGLARAPLVARMDADDVCLAHRLGEQARFMRENPGVGLLGGQADCIDAHGNVVFRERHPTDEALLRWLMHFINPFWHPAAMMRTELLREVGGYDESLPCAQDFDLFRRLAAVAPVAQGKDPVLLYRIHEASVSGGRAAEQDACALRVIGQALQGLLGRRPGEKEVRGAREILIRLPVAHADRRSVALLRESLDAFAAREALGPEKLALLRARLGADLEHLAARCPAARRWTAETSSEKESR